MRTLAIYLSILISILTYALFICLPYCAILLMPEKKRAHYMRTVTLYLGKVVVKLALKPFVSIEFRDEAGQPLVPGIYVCNHRSATDPFLVSLFNVEAIQIVKGWPMKLPFFGFNARKSGYLDASKTTPDQYIKVFRDMIDSNVNVIAFPEGTRSGSRNMNSFHGGVFSLAKMLEIPIYPCCIAGNECFPDRSFKFHKTSKIIVKRLEPVMPETFKKYASTYIFKNKIHEMIRLETEALDREIDLANAQ